MQNFRINLQYINKMVQVHCWPHIYIHFMQQYYEIPWPSLNVQKDEGNWRSAWLTKKQGPSNNVGYIAQYDCFCHLKDDKTGSSVNFWHETHTGVKTSKQCGLVTCLRSVRLNVCACLGGCSRGIFSESEWLWGLMGLKRSVGTVSWWENSSGWECTDPLDPAHIQQQSYLTRGTQSNFSSQLCFILFCLWLPDWELCVPNMCWEPFVCAISCACATWSQVCGGRNM